MLNTGNCGMKRRSWLSQKVLSILCLKLSEKNKTVKEKRNTEIKIAGRCPIQGVFRRSFSFSGHLANASAWKGSCQFLELSRTPLCCAVSRNHRLANADELSMQDLSGEVLVMPVKGASEELDAFREEIIRDYPSTRIIDSNYYGVDTFALCDMYHIIAAGSLLGMALHEGTSFPVGKVDFLNL